jgi:hypothetical protein
VLSAFPISFDALHQKVPYKDIEEKGKEDGIKYFLESIIIIIIVIVCVLLVPETFGDVVMVLRV